MYMVLGSIEIIILHLAWLDTRHYYRSVEHTLMVRGEYYGTFSRYILLTLYGEAVVCAEEGLECQVVERMRWRCCG